MSPNCKNENAGKGRKPISELFTGLDMWKAEISLSLSGETRTLGPAVCTLLSQRAQAFCSLIHPIHPASHPFSPFSLIKAGDRLKDTPKQNMALTVDQFAQVLILPPTHGGLKPTEHTIVTSCIHQTTLSVWRNAQVDFSKTPNIYIITY